MSAVMPTHLVVTEVVCVVKVEGLEVKDKQKHIKTQNSKSFTIVKETVPRD